MFPQVNLSKFSLSQLFGDDKPIYRVLVLFLPSRNADFQLSLGFEQGFFNGGLLKISGKEIICHWLLLYSGSGSSSGFRVAENLLLHCLVFFLVVLLDFGHYVAEFSVIISLHCVPQGRLLEFSKYVGARDSQV